MNIIVLWMCVMCSVVGCFGAVLYGAVLFYDLLYRLLCLSMLIRHELGVVAS